MNVSGGVFYIHFILRHKCLVLMNDGALPDGLPWSAYCVAAVASLTHTSKNPANVICVILKEGGG